jgi:hypothetical protein
LKLHLFTSPKENYSGYGYIFGAWVVAEDECKPEDRRLKIVDKYCEGDGSRIDGTVSETVSESIGE